MRCPGCDHDNPDSERFGNGCRTRLTAVATAVEPQTYTPAHIADKIRTSRGAMVGERKQVTVLFADLKGSMELLGDRDPEEARRLLDAVLERMMEAVHRYEGTVNQVMGDGIMSLFRAPLAHEDHAVRACYAALRMQETVTRYADEVQRSQGVPVTIRVGLNSGGHRAGHRQRPPHGLHRRGPDHAPGGADGADRQAGFRARYGRHKVSQSR